MKDTQLYQEILGLKAPWKVQSVEMNTQDQEIYVNVECKNKDWACPECQQRCHIHAYEERKWRHLDSCQFKTILCAKVPRVKCKEHGTQTVKVPWSGPKSRFTLMFEHFAIDILLSTSIKQASQLLQISWDQADGIKQRAVKRGLTSDNKRLEDYEHLCIDEKSYGKGHNYFTIVASVSRSRPARILFIEEGRKEETLNNFWKSLTCHELESIKSVSMDMWNPFMSSTYKHLFNADSKIVHDRFHVIKHLNDAINLVRKKEQNRLLKERDYRLNHTKYHWLRGIENRTQRIKDEWSSRKFKTLETAKAWALKEQMRYFWELEDINDGRIYLKNWINWANKSRLNPMKKVAKMLQKRADHLINYFRNRVSNGPIEGLNGKIKAIVKKAYGHRSVERLRTDILFHLGNLSLYPDTR